MAASALRAVSTKIAQSHFKIWRFSCTMAQGVRAFSSDNSYSDQQIRIERLWREFYIGSNHWRVREESHNEPLWIEDAGAKGKAMGPPTTGPSSAQGEITTGTPQVRFRSF